MRFDPPSRRGTPFRKEVELPFVVVEMWKGRSVDQKRQLIRAITDAMIDHAGCNPDHLHVVIHETAKENWGRAGVLSADETSALNAQATPSDEAGDSTVLGFGHMLLMVADLQRSVSFYVDQLGFTVRPAKPLADGRTFVAFTQGIALVAGLEAGNQQVDHMAFEVEHIRPLRDRLQEAGVIFFNDLHDGPYGLTIYVADPDGNKVELYETGLKLSG
jgi:4-oxalocrotonate tautomerase family enzyme